MTSSNEIPNNNESLEGAIGRLAREMESDELPMRGVLGDIMGIWDDHTCIMLLIELAKKNGFDVDKINRIISPFGLSELESQRSPDNSSGRRQEILRLLEGLKIPNRDEYVSRIINSTQSCEEMIDKLRGLVETV